MLITKERVGYSVLGTHYRFGSAAKAAAMRLADALGAPFFCLKRTTLESAPQRIVVIQLDHIGDMVLAGHMLTALRAAYPKAHITVLARTMAKPAADMIEAVDETVCLNTPWLSRGDSMGWPALVRFVAKNRKKYDLAIDLHGDARHLVLARLLGRFSVGLGVRGFGFLVNKNVAWSRVYSRHIVDVHMELVRAAAGTHPHARFALSIPDKARDTVRHILARYGIRENAFTLVQMSSGLDAKDWPTEYWQQAVRNLCEKQAIVTADQDEAKVRLLETCTQSGRFAAVRLEIAQYAALVSMCAKAISVDTFTVHLARLLDKPLVALYSGTNLVKEWGPYGESANVSLLQDTSCPRFPCYLKKCAYGYPSPCMKRIEPAMMERHL